MSTVATWNPVDQARKKFPGLSDWSDDQIYQNLSTPDGFRSAFPEYSTLDDNTIQKNVSQFAPAAASVAPPKATQPATQPAESPLVPKEISAAGQDQSQPPSA